MLVFLLQAATVATETANNIDTSNLGNGSTNIISLVLQANIVIQLITILLIFFSVVSWAIIGNKHRQLKQAVKRSENFIKSFWQEESVEKLIKKGSFMKSPTLNIFRAGIDSLREIHHPQRKLLIHKEIQRAAEEEIETLETGVPFLAITGSAAPFLGLLGTVWGILYAFWKIGKTGASSLAIVGPHIAEALVTTAIGLIAAIPAVIFYNMFVNKIGTISKDLFDFSDDLFYRLDKEYLSKE